MRLANEGLETTIRPVPLITTSIFCLRRAFLVHLNQSEIDKQPNQYKIRNKKKVLGKLKFETISQSIRVGWNGHPENTVCIGGDESSPSVFWST